MSCTNKDRAGWAQVAVTAFQNVTRTDDDDAISDLIADLYHLCDHKGIDFEEQRAIGFAAYEEEVQEEADEHKELLAALEKRNDDQT